MPDEGQPSSELEPQPQASRIPSASGPGTTAGVEEYGPAPVRRGWGLLEALPVIFFLLFLTGMSMLPAPEEAAGRVHVPGILLLQSLFYAIILLYIVSVVKARRQLPFWSGLGWKPAGEKKFQFLFGGLVLALAVQLLQIPVRTKLPVERLFQSREAAYLLAAFGILVAPLVEEIVFRGFIFGALERAWGIRAAVWITASLFATIHVPQLRGGWLQVLAIFGVGLVLSWMRARTGSLAPPYFIHLGYNTTLFAMLYLGTQGFRQLG